MKKVIVKEYNVEYSGLPKELAGTKFVMISDYHNNDFGVSEKEIVKKINELEPEFIVMAGDMVTAVPGKDNKRAYSLIKKLADRHTIYYANGNHEYRMRIYPENYGNMYDEFLKEINHKNIIHLVNESVSLEKGGASINIRGLEIDRRFYKRFKCEEMPDDYISKEIGNSDKKSFELLIAHNPKYFRQYARWGANLVLSGHVHGGLVRLPLLGGVISPDLRLFPKYDYGLFDKGKSKMILSSGLGAHTLKIRLFNAPEIVFITLK